MFLVKKPRRSENVSATTFNLFVALFFQRVFFVGCKLREHSGGKRSSYMIVYPSTLKQAREQTLQRSTIGTHVSIRTHVGRTYTLNNR